MIVRTMMNDHPTDCLCINCKAARDFFGPTVYDAPSMVTVGDHKREAWQLTRPAKAGPAAKPARVKRTRHPVKTRIVRDAHPFGYKPLRKGRPVTPDMYAPNFEGKYTPETRATELASWRYDNRWSA